MTPAPVESFEVSTSSANLTMPASIASATWPAHAAPGAWRFGRPVQLPGQSGAMQWVLRRNCSITPGQLGGFYLSMCVVSLLIALGFAWHGAPVVLYFAGIELLVLAAALLVYARHATDADTINRVYGLPEGPSTTKYHGQVGHIVE